MNELPVTRPPQLFSLCAKDYGTARGQTNQRLQDITRYWLFCDSRAPFNMVTWILSVLISFHNKTARQKQFPSSRTTVSFMFSMTALAIYSDKVTRKLRYCSRYTFQIQFVSERKDKFLRYIVPIYTIQKVLKFQEYVCVVYSNTTSIFCQCFQNRCIISHKYSHEFTCNCKRESTVV